MAAVWSTQPASLSLTYRWRSGANNVKQAAKWWSFLPLGKVHTYRLRICLRNPIATSLEVSGCGNEVTTGV